MRDLACATAPHKDSRRWTAGAVSWDEIIAWTEHPATAKECGGYVLGRLRGTRRAADTIVSRSALTLDVDEATTDLGAKLELLLGYAAVLHTTWRSTPEAPRYRVIIPLDRDVTPTEYRTLCALVMHRLAGEGFDGGSMQPERFMFKPSADPEHPGAYCAQVVEGEVAPADDLLAAAAALPADGLEQTPAETTAPTPEAGLGLPFGQLSSQFQDAARRKVETILAGFGARLAAAADWPEGERDEQGRGWDQITANAAFGLAQLGVAAWAPVSVEEAEQHYRDIVPVVMAEAVGDKWAGRVAAARRKPLPPPWLEPGWSSAADDFGPLPGSGKRHLKLTAASTYRVERVRWLWEDRIAMGTLSLVAGPPGTGKSTICYTLAADATRGKLVGEYWGTPKSVLVAATEDSWSHTIVPRLLAAGADLSRVFNVEVVTSEGLSGSLNLPHDIDGMAHLARENDAALLILDPLMSRLDGKIDSHKDADVRQALEPLAKMADAAGMAVLGLIHHNKSSSTNPLSSIMGSAAFGAVARSAHTVIKDPSDETGKRRLFATHKNNLGREDLPMLAFTLETFRIPTDDGDATTSRVAWQGEAEGTVEDAMIAANTPKRERTSALDDAAEWLYGYLDSQGGYAPSGDARKAGRKDDAFSDRTLKRALSKLGGRAEGHGFPRRTYWVLPGHTTDFLDDTDNEGETK